MKNHPTRRAAILYSALLAPSTAFVQFVAEERARLAAVVKIFGMKED